MVARGAKVQGTYDQGYIADMPVSRMVRSVRARIIIQEGTVDFEYTDCVS
jgi:hypothetical protein